MKFDFKTYFEYLIKETVNFQIYITAAFIGSVICFLTSNYSIVPYIVPLFVQILIRSHVCFRNRHQNALVELPAQTGDPAFIMDLEGNIILSIGKTLELFKKYAVTNIKDFINENSFDDIIELAFNEDHAFAATNTVETFSTASLKWYDVKAKATGMKYGGKQQKILVWFQDISLRKVNYLRLRDLLRYSNALIASLDDPVKLGAEYEHLSAFLLKEYQAVFITRADLDNNLTGYVFRNTPDKIIHSEVITISKSSLAPINISRKEKKVLSSDISAYESEQDFLKQNPFDLAVLQFIGAPVKNFITYNEADISVTAFNFRSKINVHEKQFFKIVVNIYKTMVKLVDLKQELQNDLEKKPSTD